MSLFVAQVARNSGCQILLAHRVYTNTHLCTELCRIEIVSVIQVSGSTIPGIILALFMFFHLLRVIRIPDRDSVVGSSVELSFSSVPVSGL